MALTGIDARLAKERRARLQAERLLALRSEELYSANRKLSEHAHALSFQVIEQREENAALKGQTSEVAAALELASDRADLAERRLWDALTAVEDGFAIFDRDCRLVAANPAFLGPFDGISDIAPGASYDSILRVAIDEGIVDLEGRDPEDWVEDMLKRWERANIPQVDIRLWNGNYVRLIDKRTPQGDTVCLGVDITATIRRERQLRTARDAALAASRAKSNFLANMSHEIRTPMNGVVSMAEMLGETDLDADQKLYADTIRHSGEALLVIINDILDYSKIEAGKLALHEEPFDLLEVVLEIFALLRPGAAGRDLAFLLDIDLHRADRLIGDCGRLRQILFNLVGNAVKFTENGHVRVTISGEATDEAMDGETDGTTDGTAEDGTLPLRIAVEDTGVGIAPELQSHIFGEFNQVEESRNRSHDGTGLGLAITKRLVGMMGGDISVSSKPGHGSTFTAHVRVRQVEDEGAARPDLPKDMRWIRVLGPDFPERARNLIADLTHLGARVHAAPGADLADAGPFHATILLPCADAGALSGDDRIAPVFQIPDADGNVAEGLIPLAYPMSPPDLRQEIVDRSEMARAPVAEDAGVDAPPPGRLRLLAAEDNKTNQLVFKTMLKALDADLTLVENGEALLEAYRERPPDLIFSDISMPVMDGLEAAELIRAHELAEGLRRVPIIAMTAHAAGEDRARFLAAGMDDVLTKPLKKAELLSRVEAHTARA